MSVYALYTELPVIGSTSYNSSRVVTSANSVTIPNNDSIKYIAFRSQPPVVGAFYSNDELFYTNDTVETVNLH
ncbi:MAG: hypothetical protein J6S85_24670 [Methanobrevibacter sp.]|nr:hypothetical protein [Methanobrevibacter sp.]